MQKGVDRKTRALVKSLSQDIHSDLPEIVHKDPSCFFLLLCYWDEPEPCEPAECLCLHTYTHTQGSADEFPSPLKKLRNSSVDHILPVSGTSLFWNHCLETFFFFLSPSVKEKSIQLGEKKRSEEVERETTASSGVGPGKQVVVVIEFDSWS